MSPRDHHHGRELAKHLVELPISEVIGLAPVATLLLHPRQFYIIVVFFSADFGLNGEGWLDGWSSVEGLACRLHWGNWGGGGRGGLSG